MPHNHIAQLSPAKLEGCKYYTMESLSIYIIEAYAWWHLKKGAVATFIRSMQYVVLWDGDVRCEKAVERKKWKVRKDDKESIGQ